MFQKLTNSEGVGLQFEKILDDFRWNDPFFKYGAIYKLQRCKADVLDVQLKQSNLMTSAENVRKLCNFVLKCLKCVWKQNVCRSNLL